MSVNVTQARGIMHALTEQLTHATGAVPNDTYTDNQGRVCRDFKFSVGGYGIVHVAIAVDPALNSVKP